MTPEQIALKLAMDFVEALLRAGPKLFELFRRVGSRDAFLTAIDATLTTARAKNDADLDEKHKG
jgi:hypothetical protein